MKRPVLFAFMVLCAVFWTVVYVLPFFAKPEKAETITEEKSSMVPKSRQELQTTALNLMLISWAGVAVLLMVKSKGTTVDKP